VTAEHKQQRIILVDGTYYIFRAYHALKQTRGGGRAIELSTTYGMPTGALLVFSNMLLRLYLDEKPDLAAVVFDAPDGTKARTDLSITYKANREEPPDDLKVQFPWFSKIVDAFRLPVIRQPGCEADDVIATLTRQSRARGLEVVIFTADKDLMQIVQDHVTVVDAMRDVTYDAQGVERKFGVPPAQVGDWLAMVGDNIDNVPGLPGIGDGTATKLLKEYGNIENILAHANELKLPAKRAEVFRDPAHVETLRTSRKLIELRDDVEGLPEPMSLRKQDWDARALAEIFRYLEFNSILGRLEKTFVSDRERYQTIVDEDALRSLVAACRAAGQMAFAFHTVGPDMVRAVLVGVALACPGHPAAYIPLTHRYLGAPKQLDRELVLAALKPLLEDASFPKYVHDSKDADVVLTRHGITLAGLRCDPMLASYILDPSHYQHGLADVAKTILNHECVAIETVCGKGKDAKQLDQVDLPSMLPYAAECADVTLALGKLLRTRIDGGQGMPRLLDEIEQPLSRVLARMQLAGIKVDVPVLRGLGQKIGEDCERIEKQIHELAGFPVNVGSPKQLGELLFDKLGLKSERMRRTKTGAYSTDADVLEELAADHPIVKLVLDHRELIKLKSTYLDTLPLHVNPDTGRLHTSYLQTQATTGRLASINPNLQNIPIRTSLGREIRRAFVAEPGWKLMSADYSQVELRVIAHLSEDKILRDAFARDIDVHAQTAAEVFGVPLDKVDGEMRRVAKAVNYGLGYGQSDFGLSRALDIPREDARKYIEIYFTRFAGVREHMERTIVQARQHGSAWTILGRRLPIAGLSSSRYQERTAAERFARNAPIQGSAADILKLAMLRVDETIRRDGWKARMLLTVHDELVFEVPADEAERFAPVVKREMEKAVDLGVPLKVDVGIADSWADAH
jgi:DNA polymerase-1